MSYLGTQTTVSSPDGRFGGGYSFQMNAAEARPDAAAPRRALQRAVLRRGVRVSDGRPAAVSGARQLKQDRRFNLSFTLAGIGSFSNFLGAFGIGQGAMGMAGRR